MQDSRISEVLALHDKMVAQRRLYEPMWQEIAERILPDAAIFGIHNRWALTPGQKRTQKMFDATAALALQTYGAALDSMLTPMTERWHGLKHRDKKINELPEVQRYYESVTDILFDLRYSYQANFASQAHECYVSNGAFGTSCLFIDDMMGRGFRYRSIHLAEIFLAENFAGIIDMAHREFRYTARQAMQRFGYDNLPECVQKAAKGKDAMMEFKFLHVVRPNELYDPARQNSNSMAFESLYICVDEPKIVRESGYRTFPYAISRNLTLPGEIYARGPASLLLPDIKQVNEMEKTTLRQGQLAVEPPVLLSQDGSLTGFNMQMGALNWGGLDEQGNELAKPFRVGSQINISFEMMQQKRELINRGFLVTVFQILVDNPQMTATEVLERAREKAQLLGPTMARQQSEFLGPIIARELDIADAMGALPPAPQVLLMAGNAWEAEYTSPFNRAQLASEGVAIQRTLEAAAPIMELDPDSRAVFSGKGSEIIRRLGKINGMPSVLMNTPDEVKNISAQQQQRAAAADVLAAAPVAADAAKNLAAANAMSASAPTNVGLIVP